ncbi:bifunctional peptidase and arginyl-hydroxylase JMJD5 [Sitodiplosis mosellana]|uniref:bifunctional peptidase and arginyl-hydroxylase JMJD5 n=1 Tax=Sitodiplosis mosellana TaxID=263140 RepID=UPI0024452134|nr:bifunctional peptidase and arginyl-hydroxylase JMJD5 [Sitodiplosis mosellana]
MDVLLKKIIDILPPPDFIQSILGQNSAEPTLTNNFYKIVDGFAKAQSETDEKSLNDTFIMVAAIKDHFWEIINTGHFSKVSQIHRKIYTVASLHKAVLLLMKGHLELIHPNEAREQCMWELDNGLLLGCPLDHSIYGDVLNDCLNIIQNDRSSKIRNTDQTKLDTKYDSRPSNDIVCDIDILERPSIQHFKENYFNRSQPVILRDCMSQWPAMSKWNTINYLLDVCQNRVIPIEIGKNYTNENWSQDLCKFEDFFRRQFLDDETCAGSKRIEYLAQHNLFDQIPTLKNDIFTPEYCCITSRTSDNDIDVDIKAWLGPEGTISPMHIDEKHNLLCQVFGSKRIILAAPDDSVNLYPFDGDMLKNTSQIDAEHLDYDRFPLVRNVKFYSLTLYASEMLYLPPKWWHFVKSLSKSFSVSFWWE